MIDVDLRTAHADLYVEAVFLVDALGHGLVETAMLGFGKPVGKEGNLVEGVRRTGGAQEEEKGQAGEDSHCFDSGSK